MVQPRIHIRKKYKKIKVSDPIFWIFTKKELIWILIFIIIGAFISFIPIIPNDDPTKILTTISIFTIIIVGNLATKKITSKHYDMKIEHDLWTFQRWGYYERSYFKKPVPIGLLAPFSLALFSLGYLKPFTFFQFNAEKIPGKKLLKSRRRWLHRREEINEEDFGYVAASGFYFLLILALIGVFMQPYFPSFGSELAKFSIFFGIWNLLPFGQLDGTKLFFGTTVLWTFLLILYTISFIVILI